MSASNHNPLFETFRQRTADGNELVGLVAYSLYKRAKWEWATELWNREGRKPTEVELQAYTRTWTDSMISGKLQEADGILATYAASVVDDVSPSIREDALRGTAIRSVSQSIAANFIYTILLICIVIILKVSGVDLLSIAQSLK